MCSGDLNFQQGSKCGVAADFLCPVIGPNTLVVAHAMSLCDKTRLKCDGLNRTLLYSTMLGVRLLFD